MADIQADKKVTITASGGADEAGNPVPIPGDLTVTWTLDDGTIGTLVDIHATDCTLAATGKLGPVTVHGEAVLPGGVRATGDAQFMVVPGDLARLTFTVGEPTEVTPD